MDQINRVVRQRQTAEQMRLKREKAERAARAIEEYEKQLKMERKIEVISEKIKKEKSKGLFMDVIIEEQSKKLEELQQKAHKDEVAKAALRQAVAEECQQKCDYADKLGKVEAALEKANKNNKELKDDLDKVRRQKAENDAQNSAEIRRLESDLELVQHVTSAIHQQRSNSAIGHFSFTTSTRTISSPEEEEEQNEKALDELAPIGAKNEQFTLEQELSLAQESEKLEEMGQKQQPMDTDLLDNAALVASEDVKEKENGRQKNGDEKSDKQKLPSATDNAGTVAPALAKSVDDHRQLKEEEQEEDGRNLATSEDSGNPFKFSEENQKQQQMDEGEEKEAEESKDKMPAALVDIGNPPKNKHTDEGEGKEAEEKKDKMPASAAVDSGNPPKHQQKDEAKKNGGGSNEGYEQNEHQQLKKTEEKQVEEESDGKMTVPTAYEHTPRRRREESEGQQPIVILHAQMVAQPAAAGPSEEKSKGCFRLPSCAKKTKKEQQKKSPPYCAGKK